MIQHMTALRELLALVHAFVVHAFDEVRFPKFMCEEKAWDIYPYAEGFEGYSG